MGKKIMMRTKTKLNGSISDFESRSTATTAAVQNKSAVSSLVLHGQQWLRVRQKVVRQQFITTPPPPPPRIEHQLAQDEVVEGRLHFCGASHP